MLTVFQQIRVGLLDLPWYLLLTISPCMLCPILLLVNIIYHHICVNVIDLYATFSLLMCGKLYNIYSIQSSSSLSHILGCTVVLQNINWCFDIIFPIFLGNYFHTYSICMLFGKLLSVLQQTSSDLSITGKCYCCILSVWTKIASYDVLSWYRVLSICMEQLSAQLY